MEGVGTYRWADGTMYIGEWKEGKMHGTGTFKLGDGRYYKGSF